MLRAAFTSQSWTAPQSHVHSRTLMSILLRMVPQPTNVLAAV